MLFRHGATALLLSFAAPCFATLSIFEHGNGIRSMAMGGAVYASGDETTALGANPALALSMGPRYDVGASLFMPEANAFLRGNAAGPDERYKSGGRAYFWIPQGGVNLPLGSRWAAGFTIVSAGVGPDYDESPYARFGSAPRARLAVGSSSLISALAFELMPGHAIGFSVNLGYQTVNLSGAQFAQAISTTPDRVTDQGSDGAATLGFSLGWKARLAPWLDAGFGYRSKSWSEKHDDYAGLLPEGGRLEVPAVWGLGFALKPLPDWTFVFDFQRYENASEKAFANRLARLDQGQLLGDDDGPGFGLRDQNAYKFGIAWRRTSRLVLRAGYSDASQPVRSSETLFAFLGPVTLTEHYTAGFTYDASGWEWSAYYAHVPKQTVRGRNSIAPAFGGGEADLSNEVEMLGVSLGRRFGK